jgi:16S rRNA G966 N2-methylase RsmD
VGIEALSRGAVHAVFLDKSPAALRTVRLNLEHTRLAAQATVVHADAFKYLAGPIPQPFDLVYVAPPQYKRWWAEVVSILDARSSWLEHESEGGGIVIAQIYPREYEELPLLNLVAYDRRKYGSTMLCFYALRSALSDT